MAALPLLRDINQRTPRTREPVDARQRPALAIVQRRRRLPAVVAGLAWTVVVAGLLGTAVFHTQLAERQIALDKLDREVTVQRERFDDLRYQRAELRSPVRLAAAASELGMSRGDVTSFVAVTPEVLARQLAASGGFANDALHIVLQPDPLDQVRAVKSVSGGQP